MGSQGVSEVLQKKTAGSAGDNVTSPKHQPRTLFSRKKCLFCFYPILRKTGLLYFIILAKYGSADEQTHTTPYGQLTPDTS